MKINLYILLNCYICICIFADEFVSVIKKTELYLKIPFNLDSQFMKLYFGEKKNRLINYSEFAQFLHVPV